MTPINKDRIAEFLATNLLDGQTVAFDEDLLMSGLLDSLGVMSLVAFLEAEMESRIPAGDITIENFESIDTISTYLEKKIDP